MPRPAKTPSKSFDKSVSKSLNDSTNGSWYEKENVKDEELSASARKLILPSIPSYGDSTCTLEEPTGTRILYMDELSASVRDAAVCGMCRKGHLLLCEDLERRSGLVSSLFWKCDSCELSLPFPSLHSLGRGHELNRRSVIAMRSCGLGHNGMEKFCSFMELPPPVASKNWTEHSKALVDITEEATQDEMTESVSRLKSEIFKDGNHTSIDEVMDCAVSVDGTWSHSGQDAAFCAVYAVSVDTGEVLDYETLQRNCLQCQEWDDKTTDEYKDWYRTHQDTCPITHTGSAQSMEATIAVTLWGRSVERNQLRYTTFVGDGDSTSFRWVCNSRPYGNIDIVKKDCVGHIQKRMGTALRRLVSDHKGQKLNDGKGLQGRGRLTQYIIQSFQNFYGLSIRGNKGNVEKMSESTKAMLYHYASSTDNQQHQFCPEGEESWCKYKRDQVTGEKTYRPLRHPLPEAVVSAVKPIIDRLSSTSLLKGGPKIVRPKTPTSHFTMFCGH